MWINLPVKDSTTSSFWQDLSFLVAFRELCFLIHVALVTFSPCNFIYFFLEFPVLLSLLAINEKHFLSRRACAEKSAVVLVWKLAPRGGVMGTGTTDEWEGRADTSKVEWQCFEGGQMNTLMCSAAREGWKYKRIILVKIPGQENSLYGSSDVSGVELEGKGYVIAERKATENHMRMSGCLGQVVEAGF